MKLLLIPILLALSGCMLAQPEPEPEPDVTVKAFSPEAISQLQNAGVVQSKDGYRVPPPLSKVPERPTGLDPVSEAVEEMAAQLSRGLQHNRVQRLPMAVVPFVSLENTAQVGRLGERLADSFVFPLQQSGFNMVDYRAVSLATSLKQPVSKQNLSALRVRYKIYFLLTGTYARYQDGIVLNARVLDTTTRQVLASAQSHIPDARLEGRLPGYNPVEAIEKGFIVENGAGPVGVQ